MKHTHWITSYILLCHLLLSVTATGEEINETTVLSFNLQHGCRMDYVLDLEGQAEIIKSRNARFVAIQEVDRNVARSNSIDEPKKLAELTGYKAFFGKAIPLQGGEYGIGILTTDMQAELAAYFALPGEEPRAFIAIRSTLEDGQPVIFACTHLDLKEENCIASVNLINEWVKLQTLPVLFMGDFNCEGNSRPYHALCSVWKPGWGEKTQPTWPANAPKEHLDHLFLYPPEDWNVQNIAVGKEDSASDHRPLTAQVILTKKKTETEGQH